MIEMLTSTVEIPMWQVPVLAAGIVLLGLDGLRSMGLRERLGKVQTYSLRRLLMAEPRRWWTSIEAADVLGIEDVLWVTTTLMEAHRAGLVERRTEPGGPERGGREQPFYRWGLGTGDDLEE